MKKLNLYSAHPNDELQHPENIRRVIEESSAMEVFTDFASNNPQTIRSSASAVDAEQAMLTSHVKLKFVVDTNNHFIGVVSLDDLNAQAIMQKQSAGHERELLSVKDFMRPRNALKAFSFEELNKASIRDVINALESSGQQHCLVIDHDTHKIRGIISASDIVRKLKLPIRIEKQPHFGDIFKAIYHHEQAA